MFRNILVIAVAGILYLVFTNCQFDVFTWKDSNNLERIVITPKNPQQPSDHAIYPEALETDSRLQHQKGPVGLGSYTFKNAVKMIPSNKEPQEEQTASRGRYPRTHSVGSPEKEEPLATPELQGEKATPEKQTGTNVSAMDQVREAYGQKEEKKPDVPEEESYAGIVSPRVCESPEEILIGSFNIDPWDQEDMLYPQLLDELLVTLAQFDLVAVQGIKTDQVAMLEDLARRLSRRAGRKFHYVAAVARLQNTPNDPVPVFFYDTTTMEVDSRTVFYAGKPGKPFVFPPLVAKFRTKKTAPEKAFTFLAVNMNLFPTYEAYEMEYLPDVVRVVQENTMENGKMEDDILFLGHIGIDPDKIHIRNRSFHENLSWAVVGLATNTWGKYRLTAENIFFLTQATSEFAGAGGVWDLREQFQRKSQIPFDQTPVWAKFSIYEGGK
ncbi:MAG: hypothetical protein Q4D62_03685 [Planctomycetia bacterium]|nr:hypothetical protein [Planctomycetia bacterium]